MSQTYGGSARRRQREASRAETNNQQRAYTDEITIAEYTAPETQNAVAVNPSERESERNRNFQYPLGGLVDQSPGRIIFTAHKIEPFFSLDQYVDVRDKYKKEAQNKLKEIESKAEETLRKARAGEKLSEDEEKGLVSRAVSGTKAFLKSYENVNAENPVGSVTLPLMRGLKYSDGSQYNIVDVGILGAAGDVGEFTTQDGQLTGAAKALSAQAAAKALPVGAASLVGAALGKVGGGTGAGALLGAVGGGNVSDQTGAIAKAATRVSVAPNERTLFERVKMRQFGFTFRMIARNEMEQQEIKNIIRFFRTEVYPEAIRLAEGAAPFAYEFPNVFTIDIKNRNGDNPGFNIQRCYLESVSTAFNSTSTGMFNGEEFVEADVTLAFREISTLDKGKVRDGF